MPSVGSRACASEAQRLPMRLPRRIRCNRRRCATKWRKCSPFLVRRDVELDQHRIALEQEREQRRQELEASLLTAAKTWKAEEEARLASALEKRARQSDAALAAAAARCETAGKRLWRKPGAVKAPAAADDVYVQGLQKEISTLRASLARPRSGAGPYQGGAGPCAGASGTKCSAYARTRICTDAHAGAARDAQHRRSRPGAALRQRQAAAGARFYRGAMCVIPPVIFFYPRLEGYLPDEVRANITAVTGGLLGGGGVPAPPTQAAPAPAQPAAQLKTASVNHAANVRAMPLPGQK